MWVNSSQNLSTYDANNNQTGEVLQIWSGSAWVNTQNYIYSFDVNNDISDEVVQAWLSSSWINSTQTQYTNNANHNLLSQQDQSWNGSVWLNVDLTSNTYDASDNLLFSSFQKWNGSAYINNSQYAYSFNVDNQESGQSTKDFDATGIKVTKGDSIHYYQHDVSGENNLTEKQNDISIYPNPNNGKFNIQWSAVSSQSVITIYNILGEEVKSTELTGNTNQVDLSAQPDGIYFYKVLSGNGKLTGQGKIAIQK
jgi:hypothetical protein